MVAVAATLISGGICQHWPAVVLAGTILLTTGLLVAHGLLNSFGIQLVALLNTISVWWHVIGVVVIVVGLGFLGRIPLLQRTHRLSLRPAAGLSCVVTAEPGLTGRGRHVIGG